MRADRRRGSDSRCCHPEGAPYDWQHEEQDAHPSVTALDNWLSTLAPFSRSHEEGEIDDLFEAASAGSLWDSGDAATPIKPVFEDPEVYELRRTALNKKLRFYHAEPGRAPSKLVALHRHIKIDGATQQTEIEDAADLYDGIREREGW
jgi:hypothetical protein